MLYVKDISDNNERKSSPLSNVLSVHSHVCIYACSMEEAEWIFVKMLKIRNELNVLKQIIERDLTQDCRQYIIKVCFQSTEILLAGHYKAKEVCCNQGRDFISGIPVGTNNTRTTEMQRTGLAVPNLFIGKRQLPLKFERDWHQIREVRMECYRNRHEYDYAEPRTLLLARHLTHLFIPIYARYNQQSTWC